MKIYLVTAYYDHSTEEEIYTAEERAKESALRWAKNSMREVWVDELEPIDGMFVRTHTCGKFDPPTCEH